MDSVSNETKPALNRLTAVGQVSEPQGPTAGPCTFKLDCRNFDPRTGETSPCVLNVAVENYGAPAARKLLRAGATVCVHGHLRTDEVGVVTLVAESWIFAEQLAPRE